MNKKALLTVATIISLSLTACNINESNNNSDTEITNQTDENITTDEEMIEASDYISKVKVIQREKDVFELKILENIKGNLHEETIPNVDSLEKNRAYLVFLRKVDGKLEPTKGSGSYILLEGDNHEIFEKINKYR